MKNDVPLETAMTITSEDKRWMLRALRLAAQGFTPPNPMVGCVIVKEGQVVGEGYHPYVGAPHAERFALTAAGPAARGAILYVTLEPCCHWGRTPPCTDAVLAAGVGRVVVATLDDNECVAGKGVEILRQAGIPVDIGVLKAQARRINEAYFHFQRTGTPFVTLKSAMTLDGKIATRTGDSKWITGEAARNWVHRLRARSGAVMVGIGTLLADHAQLNARLPNVDLPRQPLRIIVDSRLRTPPDAPAVRLAALRPEFQPLLIATTQTASGEREQSLLLPGVENVRLPETAEGRVNLQALLQELATRKIISVLVEGGGELNAALLADRLAHNLLFFIAPKLIGGRAAPTPLEGEGIAQMDEAIQTDRPRIRRFDTDLLLEARIQT